MSAAVAFIKDNFRLLEVLWETELSRVELVLGNDHRTYIRKVLRNCHAPYEVLLQADSAFLPKVYYVAVEGELTYVIEEYIQGQNLQELLNRQSYLSEEQSLQVALELSKAVETLHRLKVIHRDIKPANILLKDDGHINLIDFNVARLLKKDKDHDTNIRGTEGYAPPEQYGFMTTDQRSDWYAVGKTLEVLVGPDYEGRLSKAINKCTRFDPQDRVSSAEEFRALLQENKSLSKKLLAVGVALLLAGTAWWGYGMVNKPVLDNGNGPNTTVQGTSSTTQVNGEATSNINGGQVETSREGGNSANAQKETGMQGTTGDSQVSGGQVNGVASSVQSSSSGNTTKPKPGENTSTPSKIVEVVMPGDMFGPEIPDSFIFSKHTTEEMDAKFPPRYLKGGEVVMEAKSNGNHPVAMKPYRTVVLQSIFLFHREKKVFYDATMFLRFEDFAVVPDPAPQSPFLGDFRNYMKFNYQGNMAKSMEVRLGHNWNRGKKKGFQPYFIDFPTWGNDRFTYYLLGANPKVYVTVEFDDGVKLNTEVKVRVLNN